MMELKELILKILGEHKGEIMTVKDIAKHIQSYTVEEIRAAVWELAEEGKVKVWIKIG